MSAEPDDAAIAAFWSWFAATAPTLAADFGNEALLEELAARLEAIGVHSWEIGAGTRARYSLAFSPEGDREVLAAHRRRVALAPPIEGWELFAGRVAKPGLLELVVDGEHGELEIDARRWRYALVARPDGFAITLAQDNLAGVDADDRLDAAALVLDVVLGEERRLEVIREIGLTDQLDGGAPLSELADHLDRLAL